MSTRPRASYGVDAPWFVLIPVGLMLFNMANGIWSGRPAPFIGAALIAGMMAVGLHSTRRGKFRVWAELLDGLGLRGDERVLDVGCGRGAVLMLAAERVPRGRAVGIDLWRSRDQ